MAEPQPALVTGARRAASCSACPQNSVQRNFPGNKQSLGGTTFRFLRGLDYGRACSRVSGAAHTCAGNTANMVKSQSQASENSLIDFCHPTRPGMCFTITQRSTVIGAAVRLRAAHRGPKVRRQPPAHLKGHVRDQEVKPLGQRQMPLASPKSAHLNPQTRPASHTSLCSPPLCKQ